ncbi:MAG: ferric reductase-like transmembrane domain-containing protein [Chloroflexota bacterium]
MNRLDGGLPDVHELAPRHSNNVKAAKVQRYLKLFVATLIFVNAMVIVFLWLHDGGVSGVHSAGTLFASLGRISGLLGAYLLLIQILLLAHIRWFERLVGFGRLTTWHRTNGKICFSLILVHVTSITLGYALIDRISIPSEVSTLLRTYPDMIQASIGTALIVLVVVTSLVIVRRHMRYEAWYFVHLISYLAVFLAWLHQVPTGNEFVLNAAAAMYWTALYVITLALVIVFRLAVPVVLAFWYQLRVAEVMTEGPNVVSLRITGRHLDQMGARAGQFFLWRFLTWKLAWQSHPFSLSAAPDGQSLRITIKSLGDFTSRMGEIRPGTRVLGVGPFGLFTDAVRRRQRVALIAGGVGITPIRALLEDMAGDIVLIYRVASHHDVVFREEIEQLAGDRGITLHVVTGNHTEPGADRLMSPEHLRELVPDIANRELYVCGPPAMAGMVGLNARRAGVPQKYIHTEAFAF